MQNIYADDRTLDYAGASSALQAAQSLTNDAKRAATIGLVGAAALVDIAASLNAIVTGLATGGLWLDENNPDDNADEAREVGPDGEPMGDEERGDEPDIAVELHIGDRVQYLGAGALDPVGMIDALDISEGAPVAHVVWDDDGTVGKVWADRLYPVAAENDPANITLAPVDDEDDDDVDNDFEPDPAPKPAKKKGKKGGKS